MDPHQWQQNDEEDQAQKIIKGCYKRSKKSLIVRQSLFDR